MEQENKVRLRFNDKIKALFYNINQIRSYFSAYKKQLLMVFISIITTSSAVLLISHSIKMIIDKGFANSNILELNNSLIYMMFIITILTIGSASRFFFVTYISEMVILDIKRDLYNKILLLPISFYESKQIGDLISHFTTDLTTIQNMLGLNLSTLLRNTIMLFGAITMLFYIDYHLSFTILIVIPSIILPVIVLGRKTRSISKQLQNINAEATSNFTQSLNNIKIIQSYTNEDLEREKFSKKLQNITSIALNKIKTRALLSSSVIFLSFSGITFILWLGGTKVINGEISAGTLSGFVFLSMICATSGGSLIEIINTINSSSGAIQRIKNFLNEDISQNSGLGNKILEENYIKNLLLQDKKNLLLKFDSIHFYYPTRTNVFVNKNISIEIHEGTTTAIIGKSGSGKSTLFNLLLRFYKPISGTISFCGENILNLNLKNYRSYFAYVSQEPILFNGTILENIQYGNPNASLEEILSASKIAMAFEFIEKLPNGIYTQIGENGFMLSGGQKQRIAIARAILKNPKIMLLDEATSSLDSLNEELVKAGMEAAMKGRTTIIIAHKDNTIKNADNIIVMKDGAVLESGNYSKLLKSKNEYTISLIKNL